MGGFQNYLDQSISLEGRLTGVFDEEHISQEQRIKLLAFLLPLKIKHPLTYDHSIRVGLLVFWIAKCLHLDAKALLYAGLIHDVGKDKMDLSLLTKTEGWTRADAEQMKQHVIEGHSMTFDEFGFSSDSTVRHHRHQFDGYPESLPPLRHPYCVVTQALIEANGRIVALADCFDSLHRGNDRFSGQVPLTGEQIKIKMLDLNPDRRVLVRHLYQMGVFTTKIFPSSVSE